MALKEKILEEINSAIKEKRDVEVLVLRQLLAAVLNKEKEKRFKLGKEKPDIKEEELNKESQLTDEEIIDTISFEAKKRRESIVEFEKGGRNDLVEKEKKELELLKKYLPEQLSEEEVKVLVLDAISTTGATGPKEIGKVMAELMPKVKGKADGNLVSKVVKDSLVPKE